MRGGTGDQHCRCLWVELADALHNSYPFNYRPLRTYLIRHLPHLLLRHRDIRLVLEVVHHPSDVVIPDDSPERGDRPVRPRGIAACGDGGDERFERQRVGANGEQRNGHLLSIPVGPAGRADSAEGRPHVPEVIQRSVSVSDRQPVADGARDVRLRGAHGSHERVTEGQTRGDS